MKQSIQWHEECLKNLTFTAAKKRQQAEAAMQDALRIEKEVEFLMLQIQVATDQGKDEFDSEKFQVKRKQNIQ